MFKKAAHTLGLGLAEHVRAPAWNHRLLVAMDRVVGPAQYTLGGISLYLSPRPLIERYLIKEGAYAPELVTEIRSMLAGGGHFIDVGANIGYITLIASQALRTGGTVYAFEPSPSEYNMLLQHLALNQCTNVVPYPFALGKAPSESTLYLSGRDNPGMNSRVRATGESVDITIRPLHALLPPGVLEDVAAVKIDVEGDEMSVLEGFEACMPHLQRARFIVEVSPDLLAQAGHTVEDVYGFFRRHGFVPRGGPRAMAQWDEVFAPAGNAASQPGRDTAR